MRQDNSDFELVNQHATKEYYFVLAVSFGTPGSDVVYFTSDSEAETPDGATVIDSTVSKIGGTTQKINPDTANSEIGNINFSLLDLGGAVSTKIYDKLQELKGLNEKQVQFYIGAPDLDWDSYILFQTQIITDIKLKDSQYDFSCSDVQRSMRREIFDLVETALSANLDSEATTINVYDTAGFEMVAHGTSYSDAPGATVGYLKIENASSFEVVRYTGKTSNSFLNVTRGVLGTKPLVFETSNDSDSAIKVTEFVYLEMPAPKLLYALYTGKLYNQPGEELPVNWHLGIDEAYVRTADFLLIGLDYWDTADDVDGFQVRFSGQTKTDGKLFIERELLLLMEAFAPIYTNGEIGLKRHGSILDTDAAELKIDTSKVVSHGKLQHDLKAIRNRYLIHWNENLLKGEFTRRAYFYDPISIAMHGESDLIELKFKGLHGSKHSHDSIQNRFEALKDRYAGPPLKIKVECLPSLNVLEVGDIIYLDLPHVTDLNTNGPLARSFEVQQAAIDFTTGKVSVSLFGSSQKATMAPPNELGGAIEDSFYTSEGSNIETAFSAETSRNGDIVTLNSDIALTAGADLKASGSIYYVDGDFVVANGVTLTINDSVQLRVKGFLTVDGTCAGVGLGEAGGEGYPGIGERFGANGAFGYGGAIRSQGKIRCFEVNGSKYQLDAATVGDPAAASPPNSDFGESMPVFNLEYKSGSIKGLPDRLTGCGGAGGAGVVTSDSFFAKMRLKLIAVEMAGTVEPV